jgi:hypothetical protein
MLVLRRHRRHCTATIPDGTRGGRLDDRVRATGSERARAFLL